MEPNQNKIILFTIILTGFAGFEPFFRLNVCKADMGFNPVSTDEAFYNRLLQLLGAFSSEKLPFAFQIDYMIHLRNISPVYKNIYMNNYLAELNKKKNKNAATLALKITIDEIFEDYQKSAPEYLNELEIIRMMDPIGLIFFETKEMKSNTLGIFKTRISPFYVTMLARIVLFNCKTDPSIIQDPSWDSDGYDRVEKTSLENITTEGSLITDLIINDFLEIAMENFPTFKLYEPHVATMNYIHYKEHKNKSEDDVQILFWGPPTNGHWFCIKYDGRSKEVIVYDKTMIGDLELIHRKIIKILYPENKGIKFRSPFTSQKDETSCGLYSIMYATMIILRKEPAKEKLYVNHNLGDESLYMRLHILKMFVHRKLSMPEDWSKILIP